MKPAKKRYSIEQLEHKIEIPSRRKTYKRSYIIDLYHTATRKEDSAEKAAANAEMKRLYSNLTKAVNRALNRMEKEGLESSATRYIEAINEMMTGDKKARYRKSVYDNIDKMERYIEELNKFLSRSTATPEGELLVRERRRQTFMEKLPSFGSLEYDKQDEFLRFLGKSGVQSLLESTGKRGSITSEKIVEYIYGQFSEGTEEAMNDMINLFDKYNRGELFLDELWVELGIS